MNKTEYQHYLQTPQWAATRARRLAKAANQCEFQITKGHDPEYQYHIRCTATTNLHVHHLNYRSLSAESDSDLIVLCHFHHLVQHVLEAECELCGYEIVFHQCDAVAMVESAIETYGDDAPLDAILPEFCDSCEDMLS
jgi:hypothetical protein